MKKLQSNFLHAWGKYGLAIALIVSSVCAYPQFDKYWKIEGNITQDSIHNVTPKLGTIQNSAVSFISNGQERFRLTETGKIGIGTTSPQNLFEVIGGSISTNQPIISSIINVAPFTISSNKINTNLNADFLDGLHKDDLALANHNHNDLTPGNGLIGDIYNGTTPKIWSISFGGNGVANTSSRSDHTHTNMITGTGSLNRIAYWDGLNSLKSDVSFNYDNNIKTVRISSISGSCGVQLEQKVTNNPAEDIAYIWYNWKIANNNGSLEFNLNNVSKFFINSSGNIGISNPNPTCRLDVNGSVKATSIKLTSNAQNGYILTSDASGNAVWKNPMLLSIGDWEKNNNNLYRQTGNVGIGNNNPIAKLTVTASNITGVQLNCNNIDYGYALQTNVNNSQMKAYALSLNNSEKLLIWGDGKMEVDNIIKAKEIEVKTNVFADYVFADNYDLMPLEDLNTYINNNKHLPEVPTADDAIKNGINLGNMNVLLLKKVEELTLYVIQLKQENNQLFSEINKVQNPR
jgi:hypothetical protein